MMESPGPTPRSVSGSMRCLMTVWLLFHVTNKAPGVGEYYSLLAVIFPYIQGVIKGKYT